MLLIPNGGGELVRLLWVGWRVRGFGSDSRPGMWTRETSELSPTHKTHSGYVQLPELV